MVCGFILSFIAFPVIAIFLAGCEMVNLENLLENHDIITDDAWNEIKVCIVGDGDLYKEKGLENNFKFANDSISDFIITENLYDGTGLKLPITDSHIKECLSLSSKNIYLGNGDVLCWNTCPTGIKDATDFGNTNAKCIII